jgi:hypothetical protein
MSSSLKTKYVMTHNDLEKVPFCLLATRVLSDSSLPVPNQQPHHVHVLKLQFQDLMLLEGRRWRIGKYWFFAI